MQRKIKIRKLCFINSVVNVVNVGVPKSTHFDFHYVADGIRARREQLLSQRGMHVSGHHGTQLLATHGRPRRAGTSTGDPDGSPRISASSTRSIRSHAKHATESPRFPPGGGPSSTRFPRGNPGFFLNFLCENRLSPPGGNPTILKIPLSFPRFPAGGGRKPGGKPGQIGRANG